MSGRRAPSKVQQPGPQLRSVPPGWGPCIVTTAGDGTVCQWDARTGAAVEPPHKEPPPRGGSVEGGVRRCPGRRVGRLPLARIGPFGCGGPRGRERCSGPARPYGKGDPARLHDGRPRAGLGERGRHGADLGSGPPGASLPVLLRGHTNLQSIRSPTARMGNGSPSGSRDGTVRLWDARTGDAGAVLRHPRRAELGFQSRQLVVGFRGGRCR